MTLIWGATFTFTKIGLQSCPPFLYVIFRFLIALILVYIFFNKHFKSIDKVNIKHGSVLGLLFGGGFVLQTVGLSLTEITNSAFITGLAVVLTPFAFKLVTRNRVSLWSKIGVITAFIGLYIFTNPNISSINLGDLLTLISTLFWAFYITYMDVFTKGSTDPKKTYQLVAFQFLFAMIMPLIGFFIFDLPKLSLSFNWDLVASLAFNGIVASFILTIIHTTFQRYTTPVKAALIFSLEPIFAAIIATLFMSEVLNDRQLLGAAILMCGVLLSELGNFIYLRLKNIFS
jgi:drug/metabolite transporter (DMT)-like permease